MKRIAVTSSAIRSAGYDTGTSVLELEFVETGHVYRYFHVPRKTFNAFMKAASKGKYYNRYIKNSFAFEQVY